MSTALEQQPIDEVESPDSSPEEKGQALDIDTTPLVELMNRGGRVPAATPQVPKLSGTYGRIGAPDANYW